jgi:hypothetical protein
MFYSEQQNSPSKKKVVDGSYLHNSFVPRQDFENKTIWKENFLERSMKAT